MYFSLLNIYTEPWIAQLSASLFINPISLSNPKVSATSDWPETVAGGQLVTRAVKVAYAPLYVVDRAGHFRLILVHGKELNQSNIHLNNDQKILFTFHNLAKIWIS